MKSMQTSAVFLCQATRLQLEKSRADKEDGLDICAQERLARVEREIVELKQIVIDSNYQATIESNPLRDNSSLKVILLFAYYLYISNWYENFCHCLSPLFFIGCKM
jgi:hypothetical protein